MKGAEQNGVSQKNLVSSSPSPASPSWDMITRDYSNRRHKKIVSCEGFTLMFHIIYTFRILFQSCSSTYLIMFTLTGKKKAREENKEKLL